jgi:hypothetical protein
MPHLLSRSALCLFLAVLIGPIQVDAQPPLFLPATKPQDSPPSADAGATRLRHVTIDVDSVGAHSRTLLLNLFPDASYEAVLDRVDRIGDSLVWVGRIPNHESSSVTLSVERRTVYGRVALGEHLYIVRFVKDDVHVILQIDPATFPPERPPRLPVQSKP